MKLELQVAMPADLENAKKLYGPETGDLVAPAIPYCWPIDSADKEAARIQAEWSCQRQKEVLENDPTTRFVKVVDSDNNDELIAFGRWHRYTNGYEPIADVENLGLKDRNDPATWPKGFNKEMYLGILDELWAARWSWIGEKHYWILTTIKTRAPLEKKGAGSMVLKWGLKEAAKEGVPAYVEGVQEAKQLYEAHGFVQVGQHVFDCTPYGVLGHPLEIARMRAAPKSLK